MVEALPRRALAAAREELVLLVGRCVREQVRAVGGEAAGDGAAELRDEAAQCSRTSMSKLLPVTTIFSPCSGGSR